MDKVNRHRNPSLQPAHFIAEIKSICLKYNIRFKSPVPASALNKLIEFKTAVFKIKRLAFQIQNSCFSFFRQRMFFIDQKPQTAFF